jgi:hypothetical protein
MPGQRSKFPESLPPPVEVNEVVREVRLTSENLSTSESIKNLVSDLYWHADASYYLFFQHGIGTPSELLRQFDFHGVTSRTVQLYFYEHPTAVDRTDLIRIRPGEAQFDWQREAATGQMYGRLTLGLALWKKKELDLTYAAEATANAIANQESVIELKPNFAGIGLNLHSLWRKLTAWWKKDADT